MGRTVIQEPQERVLALPSAHRHTTQNMPYHSLCSTCQAGCHTAHQPSEPPGLPNGATAGSPVQLVAGARVCMRSPGTAGSRARGQVWRLLPSRLRAPVQLGGLPPLLRLSAVLLVEQVLLAPPLQARLHLRRGQDRVYGYVMGCCCWSNRICLRGLSSRR